MKKIARKKIGFISSIFLTGMIFASAAAPAAAQTADQLQVQISSLLAQIQALQSQLSAMGGVSSGTVIPSFAFYRDLTLGSRGPDVRALQQFLNAKGFLVASSGPGSPGSETEYFGLLTRNALARYQAANGITPSVGYFGPKTKAFVAVVVAPPVVIPPVTTPPVVTPPVSGVEGSITARISAIPSNNTEIKIGTVDSALGVEIKATNSDISVKRMFLNFSNPNRIRPWQLISAVAVYDGDNLLRSVSVDRNSFDEISFGTDYRLIVDGFNFTVPRDATRTLTVKVAALSAVDSIISLPQTLNITLKRDAIRGVDGAGLSQFAPSGDLASRSVVVVTNTTGRTELTSPSVSRDRVAIGSDTGSTSDVPLLSFTLRARESGLTIRTLSVNVTASAALTDVLNALKLYDGSTAVGSVSPSATATFTDLSIFIPRGESRTLTVRGDLAKILAQGRWVQISFTASGANIVAEDENERTAVINAGTATGSRYFIYTKAPAIAMNSSSIAASTATGQQAQADGSIVLAVTATGGDVYIRAGNGITAASNAQNTSVSVASQSNLATTANGNWKITSGSTEIFRVSIHLDNSGGTSGFKRAWLSSLVWNGDDSAVYTTWTDQLGFGTALIVGDYKTGDVFLSN